MANAITSGMPIRTSDPAILRVLELTNSISTYGWEFTKDKFDISYVDMEMYILQQGIAEGEEIARRRSRLKQSR